MKNKSKMTETWNTLIGVMAVSALKSIFENDNSKIVSKKGRRILLDNKKMEEINTKLEVLEGESEYKEIFI
jgi:hypothetical protein